MPLPPDLEKEREEKVKAVEVFSFDVAQMEQHVRNADQHTAILRAQLYLEHIIICIISEALPFKDELDLRRMNFPTKVDLCVSLGCIPSDWRASINKINDFRNKVAHKLDATFNEKERHELWLLMPEILKGYAKKKAEEVNETAVSLSYLLELLIVWLDIWRQKAAAQRVFAEMVSQYAVRVLGKNK